MELLCQQGSLVITTVDSVTVRRYVTHWEVINSFCWLCHLMAGHYGNISTKLN